MRRAALGLGLALLVGCAAPAVVRDGVSIPVPQAAAQDIARARAQIERNELDAAQHTLETMLEQMPSSRRADEAMFLLGYVHELRGDGERAVLTWRRMLDEHPRSRLDAQARLRAADVYTQRGRPDVARRILAEASFGRAPIGVRVEIFRKIAELARADGDFAETVRALAFARRDAAEPETVAEIDFELSELVSDRLRDGDLEPLAERVPRGPVHDRLQLEIAARQVGRGEFGGALATLDALPRRLRESDSSRREELRAQAMRGSRTEVYPIGILLPLSGPFEPFGQAALRGIIDALELFGDVPGRYRLLVRDSEGDPELAPRLVRELAGEGARVILGPMRSKVAQAAAEQAEREAVPLLVFSQREEVNQPGGYVFRVGTAPAEQVEVLVDYATETLRARRFAVLYPKDAYGTLYKNVFWDRVEARGGVMVGAEAYDPSAVDVQSEIRKLVGLEYLSRHERELVRQRDRMRKRPQRHSEELADPRFSNLPPYVDFDVLFIPDAAEKAGLILPQLRYYEVKNVLFLGPSDWNHPKLVEIAGREANGAVFVDGFHLESQAESVRAFVARYEASYGNAPERAAAEGYDAAMLLRQRVEERGELSAADMRDALSQLGRFSGVTGLVAFDSTGAPIKRLTLLTVRRGEIQAVDPPPGAALPE